MRSRNKSISNFFNKANDLALAEVERLARNVLAKNPKKITKFMMAMGTFFFTDKNDKVMLDHQAEKLIGYKVLYDFIAEWNNTLKLTGEPMTFTATGTKITDW